MRERGKENTADKLVELKIVMICRNQISFPLIFNRKKKRIRNMGDLSELRVDIANDHQILKLYEERLKPLTKVIYNTKSQECMIRKENREAGVASLASDDFQRGLCLSRLCQ